jgi:hypothetical protein
MPGSVMHAIVLIQNWGEDSEMVGILKNNSHVISIFHIMGRHSYLLDVNFDNMKQLSDFVRLLKSIKLPGGVPSIISLRTQKIIEVLKQKDQYSLKNYLDLQEKNHFFMVIDNPHHDDELINLLKKSPIVQSVLHVQGESSYTSEIIVQDYSDYRRLLTEMKNLNTIHHIETFEVISVLKYRNQLIGDSGELVFSRADIREIYTL